MLLSYIKRGAYNTTLYGFCSVVSRAISFLFLPYFLSHLTLSEFGIWEFYQIFFSYGTQILASCAAISLIRFYLFHQDEPLKQKQITGNAFLFVGICALLFPCLAASCFFFFHLTSSPSTYMYTTLLSISFFSLFSMVIAFLRVKEKLLYYLLFFCGQTLLAVFLTVLGIHYNYGINAFFYANCFSFFISIPFFIILLKNHWYFSFELFKEQVWFGMPIVISGFLYNGFFTIDRFFLKDLNNYELLGIYGLLWRFGSIFQILSIAMMDASPVIFYNAQKESESDFLIEKFLTYFCIILTSFSLLIIFIARCIIGGIFPHKYYFLIFYLPFFFFPLVILEVARFFQISFGLTKKTFFMPLISLCTLIIQAIGLYYLATFGIYGILLANSCAFIVYAFINYWCAHTYTNTKIDTVKISLICLLFTGYLTLYNLLFKFTCSWYYALLLLVSWPFFLWFSQAITHEEKKWVIGFFKKILKNNVKKIEEKYVQQ